MQAKDDGALLREYAEYRSDDAFAELVARHVNLVYSVALRIVGNPHRAEDIAQAVFIVFAKKAAQLRHDKALSSWLFQTTRLTAINFVREETRRRRREQESGMQSHLNESGTDLWMSVAPLLDDAVAELSGPDRYAIVLRFYEGRTLREVGAALGASEDAAEKRVSRAVDRLREFFDRHGVTASAGGLAAALSGNASHAAPAGLAAGISAAALAATAGGTGAAMGFLKLMTMTKLQTAIIGGILVGAVVAPWMLQQQAKMRRENESLRRQLARLEADNHGLSSQVAQLKTALAPTSPRPAAGATNVATPPDGRTPYQQVADFVDAHRQLPREQIEAYLRQNHRNVESLLAAFQVSHDPAYLREAATNAPGDPAVQFAVIANNVFPQEQRKWIDAFKASSPGNALPWYFSALEYFNSNQPAKAIQELGEATRRQFYGDYGAQSAEAVEEMYRLAGWPALAAKAAAPGTAASISYLNVLKSLANETLQTQQQYLNQGDVNSANTMASMGMVLGDQMRRAYGPIDELVGIAIEKKILAKLDPAVSYHFLGRPISKLQAELSRQKETIRELVAIRDQIRPTLSESELNNYWEREKLYGEMYALHWLQSKYPGSDRSSNTPASQVDTSSTQHPTSSSQ